MDNLSEEQLAQLISEMYSNDEIIQAVKPEEDNKKKEKPKGNLSEEHLVQMIAEIHDNDEAIEKAKGKVIENKCKTPIQYQNNNKDSNFSLCSLPDDDNIVDMVDESVLKPTHKPLHATFRSNPAFHSYGSFNGIMGGLFGIANDFANYNAIVNSKKVEPIEYQVPEVVMTKVATHGFVCMASEFYFSNKKEQAKFDRTDGIILPKDMGQRFMSSSMKLYSVKIVTNGTNIESFGRIVGFDAPEKTAVLPSWMMRDMLLATGDKIFINSINVPKITKLKIDCIGVEIKNPTALLEYEMRDHSISYVGKIIKTKIFDKEIMMKVTAQEPTYAGIIIGSDVDVEFG